jgi:hypothetical protein
MLAGLVYLLPVLLLALVLALRRYPGERALVALASRRRRRRRATRALSRGAVPRAALERRASMPRGGLLIAAALAVRPPPLRLGAFS